jgi:Phosphotransferase enzyme family
VWSLTPRNGACGTKRWNSWRQGYRQDVEGSRPYLPSNEDLLDAYGIEVRRLRRHPFGFESECWIADDRWFVKVWRNDPPRNLALLEQLDLPVPIPLRTRDAGLVATAGAHSYAVYPYVRGRPATWADWAEIARVMRRMHDLEVERLDLPHAELDRSGIELLRARLDHPWIRDRRDEVTRMVDRLDAVIERATRVARAGVLCHSDLIGDNLLIGDDGRVVAMLDWDHAEIAPCEHDVWIATEGPMVAEFLRTYGAVDLNPTHLEYALLRRAVGDLAARIAEEVDRPGIDTWGFDRWRRLDHNLDALTRS